MCYQSVVNASCVHWERNVADREHICKPLSSVYKLKSLFKKEPIVDDWLRKNIVVRVCKNCKGKTLNAT